MLIARILAFALLIGGSGCAIQHATVLNDAYLAELPAYAPPKRVNGAALILMSQEEQTRVHTSRATYLLGSGSEFSFEIGKITKAAAEQIFGRLFSNGAIVSSEAFPRATFVIRPVIKNLEWWYRPTKPGYNYQEVAKLDLTVSIDTEGQRTFEKTYSSGEVEGRIEKTQPLGAEANRVVHQTIRRLIEQAANDFASSR